MIVDYHMHLRGSPSGPSEGAIEHTSAAVARRERIGHDLDEYCDAVLEAKRQGMPVKLGLKVDYFPGRERELADILAPYPWDYLLGSVHLVEGEAVDVEAGAWARLPVAEVWRRYFVALRALARSGLADVLAHPDPVKLFGLRPSADETAVHYEETADAVEAAGLAVEVSTAGLRRPVEEIYPAPEFLEVFRSRGVGVTLASDAHLAENVGRDFDQALELLRSAGYDTVTVFEAREARQEPLGWRVSQTGLCVASLAPLASRESWTNAPLRPRNSPNDATQSGSL